MESNGFSLSVRVLGTVALISFSAFQLPLIHVLRERFFLGSMAGIDLGHAFFLAKSFALCLLIGQARTCGPGKTENWQTFALPLAIVFAVPPLMVIAIYSTLTDKPYAGMSWSGWVIESAAQEFFFAGFVYGALSRLHGEPGLDARGARHRVIFFTAVSFMLWHWPNLRSLTPRYMAFQFTYTFLGGCWSLQMRRWTGSVWPGIANHVLVNYLASAL